MSNEARQAERNATFLSETRVIHRADRLDVLVQQRGEETNKSLINDESSVLCE